MSVVGIARPGTSPSKQHPQSRVQNLVINRWFLTAAAWGFLLLIWHLLAIWKGPYFLATPIETLLGLGRLATEGYVPSIARSLQQLLAGFALVIVVGIPIGLLMGSVRAIDDFVSPYVQTLFVTSKEALLPFLIVVFGTQFRFRVAVVFLFGVFFLVINTADGVRSVDHRLIETARAYRLPRREIFTKVVVPASLPFIVAGLRLSLAAAIKGMVISEIWVTFGIGLLLKNFGAFRRMDMFLAIAVLVVTVGVAATTLLKALENRIRPWARASI
ncbi:MAG: ABC transporter permease [Acidimicrobiia bacterium]